jgi:hypothetical protein
MARSLKTLIVGPSLLFCHPKSFLNAVNGSNDDQAVKTHPVLDNRVGHFSIESTMIST